MTKIDFEIVEAPDYVVTQRYAARPIVADFAERMDLCDAFAAHIDEQLRLERENKRKAFHTDLKIIGLGVVAALVVVSAKLMGAI